MKVDYRRFLVITRKLSFKPFFVAVCLANTWGVITAEDKFGINVQTYQPVIGGSSLLFIPESILLKPYQFHFGLHANYVNNPIQLSNNSGNKAQSVTDHIVTMDAMMAFGITDFIQIGFNVPLSFYQDSNLSFQGQELSERSFLGFGDITINSRIRLYRHLEKKFGFTLTPFVKLPSGKEKILLGDGSLSYGVDLGYDHLITERWLYAMSLGSSFRSQAIYVDSDLNNQRVRIKHQIQYAFGLARVNAFLPKLNIGANIKGRTDALNGLIGKKESSPIEGLVGAQYSYLPHILFLGGLGTGFGKGIGSEDFRIFAGVEITLGGSAEKDEAKVVESQDHLLDLQKALSKQIIDKLKEKGIDANVSDSGTLTLDMEATFRFKNDSYVIPPDVAKHLNNVLQIYMGVLFQNPETASEIRSIEVMGHSSPWHQGKLRSPSETTGRAYTYNLQLSKARAAQVKTFITSNVLSRLTHGHLAKNKIMSDGKSYSFPVVTSSDSKEVCGSYDCRRSRRVEILFTLKNSDQSQRVLKKLVQ